MKIHTLFHFTFPIKLFFTLNMEIGKQKEAKMCLPCRQCIMKVFFYIHWNTVSLSIPRIQKCDQQYLFLHRLCSVVKKWIFLFRTLCSRDVRAMRKPILLKSGMLLKWTFLTDNFNFIQINRILPELIFFGKQVFGI